MSDDTGRSVLPVAEERLTLEKVRKVTGRVRVSTRTESEDTMLPVDLASVDVEVSRVPIGRTVEVAPEIATEGDLTIIPVIEERVVVTRELYLVEEIHVRRTESHQQTELPVTIRRQTAHVERLDAETAGGPGNPTQKDDQDDL